MGRDFDNQLKAVKSYDDLKKLISKIIKEIPYYKMINDQELLNSLEEFLRLLLSLSVYLVGKKKEELARARIKDYQDKILKLKEIVKEISELMPLNFDLYKVVKFNLGQDDEVDIPSMNRWLQEVFDLYKANGKVMDDRDFTNLFTGPNCIADNKLVSKYMKLFLRLPNDPENAEFIKFYVENFSDGAVDKVIDKNQMLPLISRAVRIIYGKNGNIFGKKKSKIDSALRDMGYDGIRVDVMNLYDLMALLSSEILKLQGIIGKAYDGAYNDILNDEYYYDSGRDDRINSDLLVQKLLKMLGKSEDEFLASDRLRNDLGNIIDLVGRMTLFDSVKEIFAEYKDKYGIDEEINKLNQLRGEHEAAVMELKNFMDDYLSVVNKKTGLTYLNGKKNKNVAVMNDLKKTKIAKIDEIEQKIDEIKAKIESFLKAFYADNRVSEKINQFGNENTVLWKTVDSNNPYVLNILPIESSQIDMAKMNQMGIFSQNGISIPGFETEEFKKLAQMCAMIMNDGGLFKRIKEGYKFQTEVNSEYLDRISSGEFDYLIPEEPQGRGSR